MEPILCAKGCGFYGSAENRNMCSKCYMDFIKNDVIKRSITTVDHQSDDIAKISTKVEDMTLNEEKQNRCKSCNKKVGLLGFKCRCDGLFCGRHRMPEKHSCTFDYKFATSSHPNLILVQADKLESRT